MAGKGRSKRESKLPPAQGARSLFALPSEGDAATSLRIVLGYVADGELPPAWAVEEAMQALHRYDRAEVETIGEAFGFPRNKHLAAKQLAKLAPKLAHEVGRLRYEAQQRGEVLPLESNAQVDGAFAIVGKKYNVSVANVKKYRNQWMKHCEDLGIDSSYEPPQYADAEQLVRRALAEALQKGPKK